MKGESIIVNVTGSLTPYYTYSCNVSHYPDTNFTIVRPEVEVVETAPPVAVPVATTTQQTTSTIITAPPAAAPTTVSVTKTAQSTPSASFSSSSQSLVPASIAPRPIAQMKTGSY